MIFSKMTLSEVCVWNFMVVIEVNGKYHEFTIWGTGGKH